MQAPKKQEKVIGFEEVTDAAINSILRPNSNKEVDVICITGLPGVGKTTLASEIFHHPKVKEAFPGTVIWLANYTSTEFSDHIVPSLKESQNYLIILDDVSYETWKQIKDGGVLPSWFKRGYSKVLLTTSDLTKCSNIKLHGMDQSRGWQLLHSKVYDKEDDDSCPDLERIGKFIVKHCAGIPRAILLIGRILREQLSATERHTAAAALRIWEEVAGKMDDYLFDPDNRESMGDCMSMVYDNLHYSYRNCLLYMAMFPQNSEIPRWKLKCLFVAEGILQSRNLYINFVELSSLNLLMAKQGPDGTSSDTCYLNNLVYQFCRRKVASTEQKNMFHRIKRLTGGSPQKTTEKSCDHHLVLEKQKRSFPCFTDNKSIIIRSITEAFNMPRVLEANTVDFHKFQASPLHLRHITLSNDKLNVVPRTISMFRNMKTLVVKTFSHTLKMEASLQELPHLEIFHTNAAIILRKDGKVQVGESLESLRHLSPQSCSHLVMNGIVELRIRGELAEHLDSSFLEKAEGIKSLYLVNDVYPKLTSEKPLPRLPPSYLFTPNLKSLTLSSTYLDWEHMSNIAHLPLTRLKLKDYAFVGDHWDVTEINNFYGLKHLSIEGTNLKHWTTSYRSFGSLTTLLLKNCDKLEGLPLHEWNYEHLYLLELEDVNPAAVSSAKDFEKARKVWNQTRRCRPLKLQIDTEDDGISTKDPLFSLWNPFDFDGGAKQKQATGGNNPTPLGQF